MWSQQIKTTFGDANSHRTLWDMNPKSNTSYRIRTKEEVSYLADDLLKLQGKLFYMNEYPKDVPYNVFLDIDLALHSSTIEDIIMAMEEYVVGPFTCKVLINNESGKIHIITNIWVDYDERSEYKMAPLRILSKALYEITTGITPDEWNKKFDTMARGIRSAFSTKAQSDEKTETVIRRPDVYLPQGMTNDDAAKLSNSDKARIIQEYSIYNRPQDDKCAKWSAAMNKAIEAEAQVMKAEKAEREARKTEQYKVHDWDEKTNSMPVLGVDEVVTQQLIDMFISCLHKRRAEGRQWFHILSLVKNASLLVKDFDPTKFLHEWSAKGKDYDKDKNVIKFANQLFEQDAKGWAINKLRNLAQTDNINQLKMLLGRPMKSRMTDPTNRVFYDDYMKMVNNTYYNDLKYTDMGQHLLDTVAYIINGGEPFYVTKNEVEGEINYQVINNFDKTRDYVYQRVDKKTHPWKIGNIVQELHPYMNYKRIDFMPSMTGVVQQEGVFNMFTGFRHTYDPSFVPQVERFDRIMWLITEVYCKGDASLVEYFLNWMAHIIQKPNDKMGIAVLLKSDAQGVGKGILVEYFSKRIVGERYYLKAGDIHTIKNNFNAAFENKLIVFCDEMGSFGGYHQEAELLKNMITQTTVLIERKGKESYQVKDFSNMIFCTNNSFPVHVDPTDRRYFLLDLENKYANNDLYLQPVRDQMNDDETARHFFHFLANRNIEGWSCRKVPLTDLKKEMKLNSLSAPVQFLVAMLNGEATKACEFKEGELKISNENMFENFRNWNSANNGYSKPSSLVFSRDVEKVVRRQEKPFKLDGKTTRGWIINKKELAEALNNYLKMPGHFTVVEEVVEEVPPVQVAAAPGLEDI